MATTTCKNDRCKAEIEYGIEVRNVPKYCSFECRDEAEQVHSDCLSCGESFHGYHGIRCRECSMRGR